MKNLDIYGDTIYVYSEVNAEGKEAYSRNEILKVIFAAALNDLSNGIDNIYIPTTAKAIADDTHSLDKETDLVYKLSPNLKTAGPGITSDIPSPIGKGWENGAVNPDHALPWWCVSLCDWIYQIELGYFH